MIQLYWEQFQAILFKDSAHAWVLVSLIYLLGTLFLHSILGASVKRLEKRISSKNLKSIHQKYLPYSILGWAVYLTSLGFFLVFWYTHYFYLFKKSGEDFFLVISLSLFLLSVTLHLSAYARACLDQIKMIEDKQLIP